MFVIVLSATLVYLVNLVRISQEVLLFLYYTHIAVCTNPCINGGTCVEPEVCQCPEPYGGVACSDSMYKLTTKHIIKYYCFSQLCVVIVTVQVVGLVQLVQLV